MSTSSRTDADRRAYCLKNLRRYLDLMMDDDGANQSAAADAQRSVWARQASFWSGILAALPASGKPSPGPGPRPRTTPPQK